MPRFNHAFDVAFEVKTDHPADQVTPAEWLAGLEARVAYLKAHPAELRECMSCAPFDTFEIDDQDGGRS